MEETRFPRIVGKGDFWCLDPLVIPIGGETILTLGSTSMANAISLMVACYYVFNIAYKAKPGNVFLFCEATLDMPTEAKKRVALNKFN